MDSFLLIVNRINQGSNLGEFMKDEEREVIAKLKRFSNR